MERAHWGLTTCLVVLAGMMMWNFFPSGYPKVEKNTYEAAQAIYAASLEKDIQRLELVETKLNNRSLDIPDQQRRWLIEMISDAKAGDWDSAIRRSRRILKDQTEAK